MEELLNKNVLELGEALRRKEISSVELTTFYLKRIAKYDGELRSYLRVTGELALEMARAADEKLRRERARASQEYPSASRISCA